MPSDSTLYHRAANVTIAKRYKVVLTVHDSLCTCVTDEEWLKHRHIVEEVYEPDTRLGRRFTDHL